MNAKTAGDLATILAFNRAVLGQAEAVLDQHVRRPDIAFKDVTGPHLRHVIEHYEALLNAAPNSAVSYDSRQRDPELEQHIAVARQRIRALLNRLESWTTAVDAPVTTELRCGLDGRAVITNVSSVGRELMFLSCHAIHHYALIHRAALDAGMLVPEGFGKAPSTVHHELLRALRQAA